MTPPKGYESTAVWEAFEEWIKDVGSDCQLEYLWEAFRDGYSAGLAEDDK